ncbi:CACTA en-spm transposon protein [Cucumis melo var. makuwa]|uniref:CACTA en-spm transposon protein n=1 Tax=Cucumis melo var. makuwa TaxID=1194695 RepID=A0A5D3CIC8_CUCMM|nr:CACTA en-spm transposon protein [Cucumis melo var. makuwa]TYK10924.1 CACTA en-spm transposon protein [Cucumis melo var. makuwa]
MGINNCHVKADQATTNDSDIPCTMLSFSSGFEETDEMLLEFGKDLNTTRGSSFVGDNSVETTQPSPTSRRRAQSRLLELERYVHANGRIPMSIAPGVELPISPQAMWFIQPLACV